MSETDYPELLIVESDVECPVLEQLPRLPVRFQVLDAQAAASAESVPLAEDLAQLAQDLGAADGVDVRGGRCEGWQPRLPSGSGRFDGLVLLPPSLRPVPGDPTEPEHEAADALRQLLANLGVRFLILAPPPSALDIDELPRRVKLARQVIDSGGPAVVLLPMEWDPTIVSRFVLAFVERLLHDSPLDRAVARAAVDRFELPSVFQPRGLRHGLDLGRIFEQHRSRIDSLAARMKIHQREIEGARSGLTEAEIEGRLGLVAHRMETLEAVRSASDEINRDRDPAGWSRLAANIELVETLEGDDAQDRKALRRRLASQAPVDGSGSSGAS